MARELAPPKSKMRRLAAADRIAHWRLEETSGTAVVDDAGISNLTSSSAANIVAGPFLGATNNRGRTTTTAHATAASTVGQRAAMIGGDWTAEVWCMPTAYSGTLLIQGAAGDYSLVMQPLAGGGLRVQWTVGTTQTFDTATGLYPLGEPLHACARRRVTGPTTCDLDIAVNGVVVFTATGLARPSGGATGAWVIGASASFGARFAGDIYEVRVSSVALDDDAIRDSWARGVRDYDYATLYASGFYEVYGRALIHDGVSTWIDLSDWFGVDWIDSMEWEEVTDDQGASGSLSLRREVFDLSMVPTRTDAATNATLPLGEALRLMAAVRLEVAVVPLGTGRDGVGLADWLPMFRGFAVAVDSSKDPVKVELFDNAAALQDVWIEPDRAFTPPRDRTYGTDAGTPVEAELQEIVIDNVPPTVGYRGGTPTIYTPAVSAVNVRTWVTAPSMNVLSALEDVVTQFGWDIRYVFDDLRQQFRLTFSQPARSATWVTGSPVLDAGQVIERARLEIIRDDIRNVIEVEYGDEDADHPGTIKRRTVVVSDATSIAKYGRRYCRIGLATDSQVNDLAGATALANMVLSDLAWPLADAETAILFRHDFMNGDQVKHLADGIHFDSDVVLATVGVKHKIAAGNARTTLIQRGTVPNGKRWKWILLSTVVQGTASTTPPAAPTGFVAVGIVAGARFSWDLQPYRGSRRFRETEIHWSTLSGFTPSAATLRERQRGKSSVSIEDGMQPGIVHYARVGHVDDMGNVSSWSAQVSVTPRSLPRAANVRARRGTTNQTLTVSATPSTVIWNVVAIDTLGRYNSTTGEYTALSAGLLDVDAAAIIDTASKPNTPITLSIYVNGALRYAGETVISSGAPDRASVEVIRRILIAPGDAVTVRVQSQGNVGQYVLNSANSRAWFVPAMED